MLSDVESLNLDFFFHGILQGFRKGGKKTRYLVELCAIQQKRCCVLIRSCSLSSLPHRVCSSRVDWAVTLLGTFANTVLFRGNYSVLPLVPIRSPPSTWCRHRKWCLPQGPTRLGHKLPCKYKAQCVFRDTIHTASKIFMFCYFAKSRR